MNIRIFVSYEELEGTCKLCNRKKHLRYGVCYRCAPEVNGERLLSGDCYLWVVRNGKLVEWFVKAPSNAPLPSGRGRQSTTIQ